MHTLQTHLAVADGATCGLPEVQELQVGRGEMIVVEWGAAADAGDIHPDYCDSCGSEETAGQASVEINNPRDHETYANIFFLCPKCVVELVSQLSNAPTASGSEGE